MVLTIGTKISGVFFGLIFPFFTSLNIVSFIPVLFVVSAVILESYIIHRMLSKPCKFVVPRVVAINFVAIGAQIITFAFLTIVFWIINVLWFQDGRGLKNFFNPQSLSSEELARTIAYPLAVLGFFSAIILFYVRFKVFCKMYVWFDKSVDQKALKKAMLCAVSASYIFWIVVMIIERIFKLDF